MSDVCEMTGLSEGGVTKLSYLHKHLTEDREIPIPDEKSLNGFIAGVSHNPILLTALQIRLKFVLPDTRYGVCKNVEKHNENERRPIDTSLRIAHQFSNRSI